MDFNAIEVRREGIFKDAVLNAAQSKGMAIIAEAQQKSSRELAQAKALCEEADHEFVARSLAREAEKEHSAALQAARAALLEQRAKLVDELFEDIRAALAEFAAGEEYPRWLAAKAEALAGFAKGGPAPTLHLRPADRRHGEALLKALPCASLAEDPAIVLGGLCLAVGNVRYNETLDAALAAERESFFKTCGLCL